MPPTSLLRRLLVGFMLVMLGIWLAALAHIVWQVKIDQARQTAIVNRAWTRQIILNMQSLPSDPAALARIGRGIEALRLDMSREAGFETHARTRVWLGRRLAYDSAPDTPLDDGWVRWVERDAKAALSSLSKIAGKAKVSNRVQADLVRHAHIYLHANRPS